ncbi:MAG: cellulose synthase family protein [Phycisphaerae bacterium]
MTPIGLSHVAIGSYILVLGMLCVYALHRYQLVYLYHKHRRNRALPLGPVEPLPRVTVQLPMYNERYVARRIIEAACRLDYPADRLQIQVLDDSTDDTVQIARNTVDQCRRQGCNVQYIHRNNRCGYKAGALENGLTRADGELICIFDADFVPPADVLRRSVGYFADPQVGMVQLRWEHINRSHSLLTKIQAVLLDGHFVIEHGARHRSGRFMSFNGTAGLWRARCIHHAGGWQHDTLTEDLDLSYRAQLQGWKFIFVPDVVAPAELPPDIIAFKDQQHRWAKGGAQTCRKLLPTLLRARVPFKVKWEAFFHLTSCTVHLYMVALILLLLPVLLITAGQRTAFSAGTLLLDASLFLIATGGASSFYVASQRELSRSWFDSVCLLPFLMALGVGMSLNNARATLAGLSGQGGEFVRTPKFGVDDVEGRGWKLRKQYRSGRRHRIQPFVELGMAIYLTACIALCVQTQWLTLGLPFLGLFALGCFYVGISSLAATEPQSRIQPSPEAVNLLAEPAAGS